MPNKRHCENHPNYSEKDGNKSADWPKGKNPPASANFKQRPKPGKTKGD